MGRLLAGRPTKLLLETLDESNLLAAWRRVRRGKATPGIDGLGVGHLEEDLPATLQQLRFEVVNGAYRPQPALRFYRPKAGGGEDRPLCVLTLRDRLLQRAIHQVLAPRLDEQLSPACFGFRRGLGVPHALAYLQRLRSRGYSWVAQGDVDNYFDSIDRTRLCNLLSLWLADNRFVSILRAGMEAGYVEMGVRHHPLVGVPQGSVLSPLFSNLYLSDFDRRVERAGGVMIRYADDLLFASRTRKGAHEILRTSMHLLAELGLRLNRGPCHVRNFQEGFEFLGHRVRGDRAVLLKKLQRQDRSA